MPKIFLKSSSGNTSYGNIVTLNTYLINDIVDYGSIFYKLKKLGIRDGSEFQIDNTGDLLMQRTIYKKCVRLLKKFGVKKVN